MQSDVPGSDPAFAGPFSLSSLDDSTALEAVAHQGLPVAASVQPRRPAGPGFWESIAWLVGVHVMQIAAGIVAVLGLGMVYLATHPFVARGDAAHGGRIDLGHYFRAMGPWFEDQLATILGIAGVATVLYGAAAVSVRLHRQGGLRGLGLQRPRAGHVILIVSTLR